MNVEYIYTDPVTDCVYSTDQEVIVYPIPTADFTLSETNVCVDGTHEITVTYTGIAQSSASFNWLFGSASIISGSGIGPYTLTWSSGTGSENIFLTVTQNGCTSPTEMTSTTLTQPLEVPVINCTNINNNSISFDWQDVEGALSL